MRIDDQEAVASAGLLPKEIAKRAASILLREVFEEGFFHADPHPGNFLVTETGVVCAMDFGMVGALSERLREQLLFLLFAVVEQDTTRVVDDLLLLGAVAVETNRDSLERDVEHLIAQYYGQPLEEIQIGRLISEIMALVRRNQLRMPAELMMLAKTIVMSEAIGRRLDPSFQVTEFAEPFVRDALRRFYRPGYWKTKLKMKPLEAMMLATSLPGQTQRLLTRVERNQLTFHVHYDELDQTIRALNGMVNRLALAVLIASMGIGLVVLYGASDSPLKTWVATLFVLGFAVTALLGAGLVVAIWRNSRD
jgi:ubiquinone biosynthesis protein